MNTIEEAKRVLDLHLELFGTLAEVNFTNNFFTPRTYFQLIKEAMSHRDGSGAFEYFPKLWDFAHRLRGAGHVEPAYLMFELEHRLRREYHRCVRNAQP